MDYSNRKYLMAEVATSQKLSTFHRGDIIFKKGDEGSIMYEVVQGSVGIYLHYNEPDERLLVTKVAGEFFGEIALLEKRPRTATAVALNRNTILEETSSSEGFVAYVRKHPKNLELILDMMSNRFKDQRADYLSACETLAEYKEAMESGTGVSNELFAKMKGFLEDGARARSK